MIYNLNAFILFYIFSFNKSGVGKDLQKLGSNGKFEEKNNYFMEIVQDIKKLVKEHHQI